MLLQLLINSWLEISCSQVNIKTLGLEHALEHKGLMNNVTNASPSVCALQHNQVVLRSTIRLCFAAQSVNALKCDVARITNCCRTCRLLLPSWLLGCQFLQNCWHFRKLHWTVTPIYTHGLLGPVQQICCSQGAIRLADPLQSHCSDPARRTASLRKDMFSLNKQISYHINHVMQCMSLKQNTAYHHKMIVMRNYDIAWLGTCCQLY